MAVLQVAKVLLGLYCSIGEYEDRKRYDYFVRYLLGIEPPNWNQVSL